MFKSINLLYLIALKGPKSVNFELKKNAIKLVANQFPKICGAVIDPFSLNFFDLAPTTKSKSSLIMGAINLLSSFG